jgi:large conductance mechanosensitive channel
VLKGDAPLGVPLAEARKLPGVVVLGYGQFLTVCINTLVLAFAVFLVVRAVNNLRTRMQKEEAAAAPSTTEVLLGEIRDLLKRS